ncbi:MAG: hypothetical protein JXX28_12475 [Deltaproteobacteria bacterium]|nr:hypothetical protein [Deltaproteobacteria bacterium]
MPMRRELSSAEQVREYLDGNGHLIGVLVRDVDLTGLGPILRVVRTQDSVFMGCKLPTGAAGHIIDTGGMIFPRLDAVPYHPYRRALYTPLELVEGYRRGVRGSISEHTADSVIYRHYQALKGDDGAMPIVQALAQRLHDHAMDRALKELLADGGRRVVGVMGGHAMQRGGEDYEEVARLGYSLGDDGYFVATGGGPGAMEAANLGAWMCRQGEGALLEALGVLAQAPDWREAAWLDRALEVRSRWADGHESLGIPTWFYGHEPTNLFATHVAKYFANSLREDGLLAIALHGVIYAPGSAGTVQEIFQDAAQNHYGTFDWVSPMVFFGRSFWTERYPVFPLIQRQAAGRAYEGMLLCTDDREEVMDFLRAHPPEAAST